MQLSGGQLRPPAQKLVATLQRFPEEKRWQRVPSGAAT